MREMQYFPLVDVAGGPYDRGLQHGGAVPERIAAGAALYRAQLGRRGLDDASIERLARAMLPQIEAFDPAYLEEMRGIAHGAGTSLEDVVVINCRTEMLYGFSTIGGNAAQEDGGEDGDCTGLVVLPKRSATGRLLHAHNWDWRQECVDTCIVLRIRAENGPDILAFTEAGALARHGFNSNGVSLTGNALSCHEDYQHGPGVPVVLLRRRLLESANLAHAMRTVWNARRYCSSNMILAQSSTTDGCCASLEAAPTDVYWTLPQDDVLVHANHWLSPVAVTRLRDPGLATRPDSLYRQHRVEHALRSMTDRGIEWSDIRSILADDFGFPDGVLRSPKPGDFSSISATVATTLMDAANKVMWVARKPYECREFQEYTL
ncbi:C45 family autoproteolytic acyltransferase/hydolase [Cupriavidus consociatus]|uniref:C45 family autoproteolytic acyltransferase/hydolase n=1 Tax=Cupriavidus consociatus TaxID=2821357 RepID=UPI001AE3BC6F|nr:MULTISPECIES: C45 family peptidase [unclassified Cupriavidus]MBP0619089.1 peptidase C45 [Cupriavidus sp. LEh25]MDK2655734.1 C45 family autoproteolytic acyltransferase/hydrolase [Cupriavidus sp. LEh21]